VFLPLLAVITVAVQGWAQVVVEPDVVTDSIDVFTGAEKTGKSRILASVASLALPGLGHQYLENGNRALVYYSTEALFIFSMIFSERYSRRMFRDSESYAWLYANVEGGGGADDFFYQNVSRFMDSDEFNRIMELNRTPENKYSQPNLSWRWVDEYFKDEYNGKRETATRFHIASSFFLAAMVVNRVVAFIDVRRTTKFKGIEGNAFLELRPFYSPSDRRLGLTLTRNFHF
jgi:hypothetical protein